MRKTDAVNSGRRVVSYNLGYRLQLLDSSRSVRNPFNETDTSHEAFIMGAWDCRHGIDRNPESVIGNYVKA